MHGDTTCDRLAPVKKGSVVRRACVGAAGGRSVCAGCVCRSATRSKEFLNGHRRVCWHCAKRARRPELMIRREFFIYYIFTATAAAAFPYRSVRRVVRTIRAPKNTPPPLRLPFSLYKCVLWYICKDDSAGRRRRDGQHILLCICLFHIRPYITQIFVQKRFNRTVLHEIIWIACAERCYYYIQRVMVMKWIDLFLVHQTKKTKKVLNMFVCVRSPRCFWFCECGPRFSEKTEEEEIRKTASVIIVKTYYNIYSSETYLVTVIVYKTYNSSLRLLHHKNMFS